MASTCSVDGCERPVWVRGWCSRHYQRWRTTGDVGPVGPKGRRESVVSPDGLCFVDGCDLPTSSMGLCPKHYARERRYGSPTGGPPSGARPNRVPRLPKGATGEERFWSKVCMVPGGCWLWMAHTVGKGYGRFHWRDSDGKQVVEVAHRFSYRLHGGVLEDGQQLDHLCRERRCVNPDHLEPVTQEENQRRGRNGVLKTHCINGHPYVGDNVMVEGSTGRRRCVTCTRETKRRWKAKQKQT